MLLDSVPSPLILFTPILLFLQHISAGPAVLFPLFPPMSIDGDDAVLREINGPFVCDARFITFQHETRTTSVREFSRGAFHIRERVRIYTYIVSHSGLHAQSADGSYYPFCYLYTILSLASRRTILCTVIGAELRTAGSSNSEVSRRQACPVLLNN